MQSKHEVDNVLVCDKTIALINRAFSRQDLMIWGCTQFAFKPKNMHLLYQHAIALLKCTPDICHKLLLIKLNYIASV